MTSRTLMNCVVLSVSFCSALTAEVTYPEEARQLLSRAQYLMAPVALQTQDYQDVTLSAQEQVDRLRRACLYLEGARLLDPTNAQVWSESLRIYMSQAVNDPSRAFETLSTVIKLNPNNLELVEDWLSFQLNLCDTREQREALLLAVQPVFRNVPQILAGILRQRGRLAEQVGQMNDDVVRGISGALSLYLQSYEIWPYDTDLMAHILKISPPGSGNLNRPFLELVYWRSRLQAQPYELEALISFLEILQHFGLVKIAAEYYDPAYEVIKLQEHRPDLLYRLQRNHLLNLYTGRNYTESIALCEAILREHPQDLAALSYLYRSLVHIEQNDRATIAGQDAADRAQALWNQRQTQPLSATDYEELLWYYSFVEPNAERILSLIQSASERQSLTPPDVIAYALWLNQDTEGVKQAINDAPGDSPLWRYLRAARLAEQKQWNTCLMTLTGSQRKATGMIADLCDELYQQCLAQPLASRQTLPSSPREPDEMFALSMDEALKTQFGLGDIKIPSAPAKSIRCTLELQRKSDVFFYNDPLMARLKLGNLSDAKLVLGPGHMINPLVFVFAEIRPIRPGSLRGPGPSANTIGSDDVLLTYASLGQRSVLEIDQHNEITLSLNIGPVRELLQSYPQGEFRITFKAVLDPVFTVDGLYQGNIAAIQPHPVTIVRKAFVVDRHSIRSLYQDLKFGDPFQRAKAIALAGGLLREAQAIQLGNSPRGIRPAPSGELMGWLAGNLESTDFRIRAATALAMQYAPLQKYPRAVQSLTKNLNHPHYLVRFVTAQALEGVVDLSEYDDWVVKNDSHQWIQRQVQFRSGQPWHTIPFELPGSTAETAADASATE